MTDPEIGKGGVRCFGNLVLEKLIRNPLTPSWPATNHTYFTFYKIVSILFQQRETEHRRHGSPSISVKTSITSSSSSRHLHPPPDTGRVYTNRHSQQADTGRMAPERHSQHVTSDVSSHGNEPETGRTRQQLVDILIELQKGAEQEAGIGHVSYKSKNLAVYLLVEPYK